MEKPHWLFVEGTQGDANFWVGLPKYVIPALLYARRTTVRHKVAYLLSPAQKILNQMVNNRKTV